MRQSEHLSKLYRPPLEKPKGSDYLCLEKNEPPFSAFDTIENMFSDMDMQNLRVYPNLYGLYEKLASFAGVNMHNLLLTQGSEQALKNVFEVFVEADDEVVYFYPSFAMYDVFSYQKKAKIKHLHFDDKGQMNVKMILENITEQTRLFSLISPHNFTGSTLSYEQIQQIVEHTKKTNTLFLLDEAYFHYEVLNTVDFIKENKHVIITRTFSKALGIPGARVGYALAHESTIELLRKVKPIDEIDYLAGHVANKVLDNAQRILDKNVQQVKKWQGIFSQTPLKDIEYIPTKANFILLRSFNHEYHKRLFEENKIIIKSNFDVECLKNCLRFSIVDDHNMQRILKLFQE